MNVTMSKKEKMDAHEIARAIIKGLTKEELRYASNKAQHGKFVGFAALYDLMDANMLLVDYVPDPMTDEGIKLCNSITREVDGLIVSGQWRNLK